MNDASSQPPQVEAQFHGPRRFPGDVPVWSVLAQYTTTLLMLLPLVHQLEPLLMSGSGMVCVIIGSISILPHVPVDDFRHVGAAARAAEGRALPDAAGDQLEWADCDLRAGRRDTDDDGLAPAVMARCRRARTRRTLSRVRPWRY